MTRELIVYLDGVPAGMLTQSLRGSLEFRYHDDYAASPAPTPLSWSLPLARTTHPNKAVRPWLEGLLPDSERVLERWGRQYGVSPHNPFALLRHVGRDAAGAVQILEPGEDSTDAAQRRGDVEWLTEDDVVRMLRELVAHLSDWNPGRPAGRWSLAGAQAKLALFRDPHTQQWGIPRDSTPTTHILKPVIRGLDDQHLNEMLCLLAAQRLGIPAAAVEVIEAEDVEAVVSVRYDRVRDSGGNVRRLHQEDLCQALSVSPGRKYQDEGGPGVAAIADLFTRFDLLDRDRVRSSFFDALAYNVAIGGTDGHAKNYSLLLTGRRTALAPLYDVSSAAPYRFPGPAKSAMKIGEHWDMRRMSKRDWASVARKLDLDPERGVERAAELRVNAPRALHEAVSQLPPQMRDRATRIARAIEEHANSLAAS